MADEKQLKRLKNSVNDWNEWRRKNPKIEINLRGANLEGANLRKADFGEANLERADLGEANLERAILEEADLRGADLREANLERADLERAILRKADLDGANLERANLGEATLDGANLWIATLDGADLERATLWRADLERATLDGANLRGAFLWSTLFIDVDLSSALHLEDVIFWGPCIINNNTLIKSPGLPVSFLRGCGLSDWEIESTKLFNPKLSPTEVTDIIYKIDELRNESPIQIHNLFISYSHGDADFVDFFEAYLNKRNIRFWRDVHDATAGPLEAQIVKAIDKNGTVLLILSKDSIESDWVRTEIEKARELEKKSGRYVLCPVALDDSWNCKDSKLPQRLMYQIKDYNILDFSGWKTSTNFEKDFEKLAKGLDLFYRDD